jgi:2-hydroxy-3-oxopropionate reductase
MTTRERIGFIGLGEQGKPMAVNLVKAGFEVSVLDLRPEPVRELTALGAKAASTPGDLGRDYDTVCVMVVDDAQVEAVVLGEQGILPNARACKRLIIHSTVRPSTVCRVGVQAQQKGIGTVDAPVSGGPQGGEARTLSFMVGGEPALVEQCRPLFQASGSAIEHFGPLGAGVTAKLAHQVALCHNILGAYEAMSIVRRAGLDQAQLQSVLRVSAGQSRTADNWLKRRPTPHAGRILRKDLTIALDCAQELGLSLVGAKLLHEQIDRILATEA